ncbi:MAG: glycoside hydrolase family 43 protein [Pseudomonadota bacterium]|nr:glycoside hydrolase family 43 protein [Pseudomonadota bacterium]
MKSFSRLAAFALLMAVTGCAAPIAGVQPMPTYSNPVLDLDFPDPATLTTPGGTTYVYATQGNVGGTATLNIRVARSNDLTKWTLLGDALPTKPVWASKTQDFWAPHVHAADGRYFLYYSAKPDAALTDDKRGLCLGVATASRPEGPFVDSGKPMLCGPGFVNIDPMAYDDPATGKRLLYWGSGFEPIKVQELSRDRLSFAPGSVPTVLVTTIKDEDPANYQRLIEGAWIVRRSGYYYLFYSGDNCCGPKAHYAVMVARSRSATGPFETLAAATGAPNSVILQANAAWIAPGHNAVVTDARGDDWIVYHAVDARRTRSKESDEVNSRRVMLIDRIEWVDGWPRIAGGTPSTGPRQAPRMTRRQR